MPHTDTHFIARVTRNRWRSCHPHLAERRDEDAESTGALGVYFVPRLGAEKAAAKLRWPIRKQVSIAIMDGDRKLKHLRMDPIGGADDERAFFLEVRGCNRRTHRVCFVRWAG